MMTRESVNDALQEVAVAEEELKAAREKLDAAKRKLEAEKNPSAFADQNPASPAFTTPSTQPYKSQPATYRPAAECQPDAQYQPDAYQPCEFQSATYQPDAQYQPDTYQPATQYQPATFQSNAQYQPDAQYQQVPLSCQQPYPRAVVATKDHVAAGLLAVFLGAFGVHKFYLGYNTSGFIMLGVSIMGGILTATLAGWVVWLIGIIEGIIYLTRSQSEFEQIYVFGQREWF